MISLLTPTGDNIAGKPIPIYCNALKAHFPLLHSSSVRGITPISHDEYHLGTVEAGMSFGQSFFDQFKEKYKVDISLSTIDERGDLKPFATTLKNNLLSNIEYNEVIVNGEMHYIRNNSGNDYAIFAKKIKDFS